MSGASEPLIAAGGREDQLRRVKGVEKRRRTKRAMAFRDPDGTLTRVRCHSEAAKLTAWSLPLTTNDSNNLEVYDP